MNPKRSSLSWGALALLGTLASAGCSSEDPAPYAPFGTMAVGTIGTDSGTVSTTGAGTTGGDVTTGGAVPTTATTMGGVTAGTQGGTTGAGFGGAAGTTGGDGDPSNTTSAFGNTNGAGTTTTMGAATTGEATTGAVTSGGMVPDEPYCAPTMNWDPEWATLEQEILEIVNQVRAEGANCGGEQMPPVGPLMMDDNLQCAARMHSLDMDERDFFDHDNPDGDGPSERMDAAGYDGRGWGENIAAGNNTAEETMDQWMNSPGHCRNIMSDNYTLIGVGYHTGGQYGHLWTQTFGG